MKAIGLCCSVTPTALIGMPAPTPRIIVAASTYATGLEPLATSCDTVVEPLPSWISTSSPSSR
jgi:hypothetical protein